MTDAARPPDGTGDDARNDGGDSGKFSTTLAADINRERDQAQERMRRAKLSLTHAAAACIADKRCGVGSSQVAAPS